MLITEYNQIVQRIDVLDTQDRDLSMQKNAVFAEYSSLQHFKGCRLPVEYLHLTTRLLNQLQGAGYSTVDQVLLAVLSAEPGQMSIPGFGKKSWADLLQCLTETRYMPETRRDLEQNLERMQELDERDTALDEQITKIRQEKDSLAVLVGHNVPIQQLGLSARAYNRLSSVGYQTVNEIIGALIHGGPKAVMAIHHFGEKSWHELLQRLEDAGYMPEDLKPSLDEQFVSRRGE